MSRLREAWSKIGDDVNVALCIPIFDRGNGIVSAFENTDLIFYIGR